MNLYIFDKTLEPLTILENFDSLRWLEEYNGDGEFQLICNHTNENVEFLIQDYYIWKNDSETCGVIEFIEIKDDIIEVRGRLLNKFLNDRIVVNETLIENLEIGLRKIVQENCIDRNPIQYLELDQLNGWQTLGDYKTNFEEVGKVFNNFLDIGYKIKFNYVNKKFILNMYKGIDKSVEIVFCEEFENIFNQIIDLDKSNYKNVAYVYGEKVKNKTQKSVIIDLSDGQLRREVYIEANDIVQDPEETDDEGNITKPAMTDEEYKKLLTQRGIEKLAELVETKAFKCDIVTDGMFKYKTDYNLGDFVTCRSDRYKLKFKVMITAIQEIYDINGYQIIATLGRLNKEDYYG